MTDHATERGELLARLEHRCVRPGEWLVEGHTVTRHKWSGRGNGHPGLKTWWEVDGDGPYRTFTAALRAIADEANA